jgi:hypothetical protein
MGHNVACHHSSCCHEGPGPNDEAANDGRVGTNGCSPPNQCWAYAPITGWCSGVQIVSENGAGPDEHLILDRNAPINRNIVLDLAVVSNNRTGIDIYVLSKARVRPHTGSGPEVTVMPYSRCGSDCRATFHDGRLMHKCLITIHR